MRLRHLTTLVVALLGVLVLLSAFSSAQANARVNTQAPSLNTSK